MSGHVAYEVMMMSMEEGDLYFKTGISRGGQVIDSGSTSKSATGTRLARPDHSLNETKRVRGGNQGARGPRGPWPWSSDITRHQRLHPDSACGCVSLLLASTFF